MSFDPRDIDPAQLEAEILLRELENRSAPLRADFGKFVQEFYRRYHNREFVWNWHYQLQTNELTKFFQTPVPLEFDHKLLMFNVVPQSGKCLDPATKVLTHDGIKTLAETVVGDEVASMQDKQLVFRRVLAKEGAYKNAYRVKTRTGRTLIGSFDHPLYTQDGWKQMQDLTMQDFLYAVDGGAVTMTPMPEDELRFIAYMLFEGECGKQNIRFSNQDEPVVRDFYEVCARIGVGVKQYSYSRMCDHVLMGGQNGVAANLLRKYGIHGQKSTEKRLPKEFFFLPPHQQRIFVGIMMATDGYICNSKKYSDNAGIALANEGLIDDIQMFLALMGCVTTKMYKANDHAGAWLLYIGAEELLRVGEGCDFFHKQWRYDAIRSRVKTRRGKTRVYPKSFRKFINQYQAEKEGMQVKKNISEEKFHRLKARHPRLVPMENIDFMWDAVVSIEAVGEKPLIHLQVEETECFVANGLVSHNTEIMTKLFPIWCMGNSDAFRVISTGYSADLAMTFSEQARNYYQSPIFKEIFPRLPELVKKSNDDWGDNLRSYKSVGVSGSTTGKSSDLFIIDDPINPADTMTSDVMLNKVNAWWSQVAVTRLSPMGRKLVVIIMQRVHDNDLCGYLLTQYPDRFESGQYKHISIPAEAKEDEKYRKKGESFFPKFFSLEMLRRKRETMTMESGENLYASQYQQDPLDVTKSEFRRDTFQYFRDTEIIDRSLRGVISIDPAISEAKKADSSSISVVAKDAQGNYYRRSSLAGRWHTDILIDNIFNMQAAFGYPVVIEANGFQKMIADAIRKLQVEKQQFFQVIEVKQRGDKVVRIRATLQPLYAAMKIFHREQDKFSNYEEELMRFPNARHDDEVDSMEQGVYFLSGKMVADEDKEKEKKKAQQRHSTDSNSPFLRSREKRRNVKLNSRTLYS